MMAEKQTKKKIDRDEEDQLEEEALNSEDADRWAALVEERAEDEKQQVHGLAEKIATHLNEMIEAGHDNTAFMILITLAAFKDGVLDLGLDLFFGIGEIPVLGQLPGLIISGVIFFFIRMRASFGKRFMRRLIAKRLVRILAMFFVDCLPLVNNLPMATINILWIWHDVKKEAEKAESDMQALQGMTKSQLEQIDNDAELEMDEAYT